MMLLSLFSALDGSTATAPESGSAPIRMFPL